MDVPYHRLWMYHQRDKRSGELRIEFINRVEEFDKHAWAQHDFITNGMHRYPYAKCKNTKYLNPDEVKMHLSHKGFIQYYWFWTSHTEVEPSTHEEATNSAWVNQLSPAYNENEHHSGGYDRHQMETMLNDAFRSDEINIDTGMNTNAKAAYSLLHSAQQPLYKGLHTHTELSAAMRLLSIKSEHNMSDRCFDDVSRLM